MTIIKNQFKLFGRVGKCNKENVVDIKYFDSGKCCAKIRLSVKITQDKWDSHFITFWNTDQKNIAEQVAETLKEGDYIQVIGKMRLQEYVPNFLQGQLDANGQQIKIQSVNFIGTSYKYGQYNDEIDDFEIVGG